MMSVIVILCVCGIVCISAVPVIVIIILRMAALNPGLKNPGLQELVLDLDWIVLPCWMALDWLAVDWIGLPCWMALDWLAVAVDWLAVDWLAVALNCRFKI